MISVKKLLIAWLGSSIDFRYNLDRPISFEEILKLQNIQGFKNAFDGAVTLDFQSVDTVSHSFADELIGKLAFSYGAEKFKEKIKIINLSEANRNIFGYVIADRFSEQESHA